MKKISFILMALAMVMGMTQCKKEQQDVNGNNEPELVGEKYEISLTLGGNSETKADVYPFEGDQNYAPVYYKQGDYMQVVYKGQRVGALICTSATEITASNAATAYNTASASFSGSITIPDGVEVDGTSKLYFLFLGDNGNVTPSSDFKTLTVDISDQTGSLPVISYAWSKDPFVESTENTTYTIDNGYNATGSNWLLNQCALVRFTCENIYDQSANGNDNNPDAIYTTAKPITIYGMDNKVTVTFNEEGVPQFGWGKMTDAGAMTLYMPNKANPSDADKAVRYAIVKPATYTKTNEAVDVEFIAKSGNGKTADPYGFFGTCKFNAEVANNQYYPDAEIDLVWHSGAMSVASNKQVVFSRGNLQYKKYDGTWRLAKHQYDWVGGMVQPAVGGDNNSLRQGNVVLLEGVANNTSFSQNEGIASTNTSYQGWIDLYGWGTGDAPTMTSTTNSDYTRDKSFVEWGTNDITNSGKPGANAGWRTLKGDEYKYLIGGALVLARNKRSHADDKVGLATLKGTGFGNPTDVHGIVILPDEFTFPTTYSSSSWTSAQTAASGIGTANWTDNQFTLAQWLDMEAQGAVFLPCAGRRNGTDYDGGGYSDQDYGVYTASDKQGNDASWTLCFGYDILNDRINPELGTAPDNGHSVRLVYDVQ